MSKYFKLSFRQEEVDLVADEFVPFEKQLMVCQEIPFYYQPNSNINLSLTRYF